MPSSGGQKGLGLVLPLPPPPPPQHCLSGTWQCTRGMWWTMRVSPVSFGGLSILESSNKGINSTRHCPWSPVGQNTFHQESLVRYFLVPRILSAEWKKTLLAPLLLMTAVSSAASQVLSLCEKWRPQNSRFRCPEDARILLRFLPRGATEPF